MSAETFLLKYSSAFDDNIGKFIPANDVAYSSVINSVNHSLSAGGKRIRPALLMEFCRVFGGVCSVVAAVMVKKCRIMRIGTCFFA